MIVGTLLIEIGIEDSLNLKDKRRILKSIIERLKNRFNISIAEVDNNDIVNYASLGISTVSNRMIHIDSVFDKIRGFIENNFNVYIIKFERNIA